VGTLNTWSKISATTNKTSVIKTDGTLWTWGYGAYGRLGLGNTTSYSSPKQVGALTIWASTSNGTDGWQLALQTNGTLWSWGVNNNGQLGLGNLTYYSSPKQIGALTNWLTISAGYQYALAIKTDGSLWAWGNGGYGRLGLGDVLNRSSPTQVGALTDWLRVANGYANSLAIKTDGTLWVWGGGFSGGLGLGNTTNYSSPKQVGSLTTWSKLSGASYGGTAIKTDGTMWAWGNGGYGQLGDGSVVNKSSPIQVGALTTWLSVSAGYSNHKAAIKTDGTLWMWGRNNAGQLGDSTTVDKSSPIQIGALTSWASASIGADSTVAIAST
jgi:alpha-tubulin suppressor-like RCC1 family protein